MREDISLSDNIISVLMGKQEHAYYNDPEVPKYKGNPLIEALPPINTYSEVGEKLLYLPEYDDEDRLKPPEKRMHFIEQIRDYMQPLLMHLQIESNISIMIRRGYIARNPLSPYYANQFAVGIKNILNTKLDEEGKNLIGNQSTAKNYTIIGISGIGKSTAVEKILLMYPQVISHTNYSSGELKMGYLKQVVWLKLECPFNGSRRSLCKQFFLTIDRILQTNYYKKFVTSRVNEEDLIIAMSHICALHCVGVLVIDEVQRMKVGEKGQEMIDFFVELSDRLGVPLIYIGTYKAKRLFDRLLANGRRASGMGSEIIDPMKEEDEWDLFLSNLWGFQWTKKITPLTDELSTVMYDLTQGITDIVINLFIKSQQYAIAYGHEMLSVTILKKAAKQNLRMVENMIDALRKGDESALQKYDDIHPGWVTTNEYLKTLGKKVGLHGKISSDHLRMTNYNNSDQNFETLVDFVMTFQLSEQKARNLVSQAFEANNGMKNLHEQRLIVTQMALNYVTQNKEEKVASVESSSSKKKSVLHFSNQQDIRLLANNAKKANISINIALKEADLIKDFSEYID